MSRVFLVTVTCILAAVVFSPMTNLGVPELQNPSAIPLKFMRDPHIANGTIVFSYQGDI